MFLDWKTQDVWIFSYWAEKKIWYFFFFPILSGCQKTEGPYKDVISLSR